MKRQAWLSVVSMCFTLSSSQKCDFFTGSWYFNSTYPLYNVSSSPFVERQFSCHKNGRPDSLYTKYRWQPEACTMRRFDGRELMERYRGKKIMFVGDSLSKNQWQSLTCMLHSSDPTSNYTLSTVGDVTTFSFTEYELDIMYNRNMYLVDVESSKTGRVLDLDSINGGKLWTGNDVLIFNTWHWWNRRGPSQPWDYIKVGNEIRKDMNRLWAFERALRTWASWVNANVNPEKTSVFYQGISPSHYNGSQWGEPGVLTCKGQIAPLSGSSYPGGVPEAVGVMKKVLKGVSEKVTLLDITLLSLLRKDGHPSVYGYGGPNSTDCSHWCLAGVPDTWNEILFNYLVNSTY